jgi:dolichol-phosphate mannosyltransferase
MPTLELVVPVYNEQEGIVAFHQSLAAATESPQGFTRRYIYVDDGSTDDTPVLLERLAAEDSRVTIIRLSRNFGHQAALTAGLDAAEGDVVLTMDGDGQHPPSLIPEMLKLHLAGYDIVQAQRIDVSETGVFKRSTSRLFYRLLSAIGEVRLDVGVSDFRLMSRRALDAIKLLPEYHRFLRGMTVWIGFPTVTLPYTPPSRTSGETKYSVRKMFRLAADGLFSFSLFPLRIALLLGCVFLGLALFELAYIANVLLSGRGNTIVPGWTSIILLMTAGTAINLIIQGILGVYIGMIFREVKRRPVYIVRSRMR